MSHRIQQRFLAAMFAMLLCSLAQANSIITFEGFNKGTIIDDEYAVSHGVTIRGYNRDRQADNIAVVFDSNANQTADSDLEAPFYNTDGKNLGVANPGNILIIHEHPGECNAVSCGNDPDDEGSRPAGYFDVLFDQEVTLNSLDFFDVEAAENGNTWKNEISFTGSGNYSSMYSPATGGNNTWTRLDFNLVGITSLRIRLGGSGAIDNLNYSVNVPTPSTILLLLAGIFWLRMRRTVARASVLA